MNPNINHHKLPFFEALQNCYGVDNTMYATPMVFEEMRVQMGFSVYEKAKWLYHVREDNKKEFENIFYSADIVLCSVRDYYRLMKRRLESRKITFYFSERWFKPPYGKIRLFNPHMLKLWYKFYQMSKSSYFYYLAQGEYAANDFKSSYLCIGKILNFGYFTSIDQNSESKCLLPKGKVNVLWCGRMLTWKKVENLVQAFIQVSEIRSNIHLTLVGKGECEIKVLKLISGYENIITHHDFLPTKKVRSLMNQADIYVLPSNGTEGWGAVVNEAMAEGCAIIGSNQAGSVKTMIKNKVNGLVLYRNDVDEIQEKLLCLIDNPIELDHLKSMSLNSIQEWSPENVCSRFVQVVDAISNNNSFDLYQEGPFKSL